MTSPPSPPGGPPDDWARLLDGYLAGECSPAEQSRVLERLAESADLRTLVGHLQVARAHAAALEAEGIAPDGVSDERITAAFTRLEQQIGSIQVSSPGARHLVLERAGVRSRPEGAPPRARRWRVAPPLSWASRFAAASVLAAAFGVTAWLAGRRADRPSSGPAGGNREYTTARGQIATVRLLDGTQVTMNVGSHLSVPTSFAVQHREVELDGEAFFVVVHDPSRPFVVRTQTAVVRDVGTQFDVTDYSSDTVTRVVVAGGTVNVSGTLLDAGDAATIARSAHVTVTPHADVGGATAWMRGRFEFTNEPLRSVLVRMGRWYDIDVRLEDAALGDARVSGSYGDEPASQVLALLTAALGARYEWTGRVVTIRQTR